MSETLALAPSHAAAAGSPPAFLDLHGHHHPRNGTLLGFWLYLMSDLLIFACLFATYGVLGRSYAAGPSGAALFELPLIAVNTALLLLSSITYGFAMIAVQDRRPRRVLAWLAATGLLGLDEVHHLIHLGAGPQRSAFLSAFFALVGTHGLHVFFGVVWLVVLMIQVNRLGLTAANRRRLFCLSMFWHFLDVVWIGVFTFVYLMGVL
jgi:cytochrome o ubiquinol oxidase subunit 3